MERENFFGKYSLCVNSLDKLNAVKNDTANTDSKMKDAWRMISWEEPEKTTIEKENDCDNNSQSATSQPTKTSQEGFLESTQATQYAFTQIDRSITSFDAITSIGTIIDLIYETLERSNGKLDMNQLQNISDSELSMIVNELSKKLSHKGIYNLCHSICAMKIEQSERLISHVCRDVLLTAIISNEEPSRLLNAAITECVGKFPEDVENLTFIPVLNIDLKEVSTILSITSSLDVQKKRAYISDLSAEVKDFKQWHIPVLSDLLTANLDDNTRDKVLNLLWKKSYDFSKDKNYGKLILNLLKTNPPTTMQQKHFFEEIAAVHCTLFKKMIGKILDDTIPV